jgi:hypothetical protein
MIDRCRYQAIAGITRRRSGNLCLGSILSPRVAAFRLSVRSG